MQEKSSEGSNEVFQRLRQIQVRQGLTWEQVAKKLGISVSMLMMLKRGKRNLGKKTLYRLEQLEHELADRRSKVERVVDGLLEDEGSAAQLIDRETGKKTRMDLKVDYSTPQKSKSLPKDITLWKPNEAGCAKLRQLFAETLDTTVILLACLPETLRTEKFLAQLTTESRTRLNRAALDLVIPEWRQNVASQVSSKHGQT